MTTNHPYANADQFLASMQAGFPSLSKQLKTIAQYVEKNRERLVLDGVHDVARHCGVQPSAIIRFAKLPAMTSCAMPVGESGLSLARIRSRTRS